MAGRMGALPMFPLGSVLFPFMPLRLRVFEERYLIMLAELMKTDEAIFGVVLIERGHEVGGGEQRFSVGTTAEVIRLGAQDGFVGLLAQGGRRFEVVRWLDDAPHPRAVVRVLPELEWDPAATKLRTETERLVRRMLSVASEFAEDVWPADTVLAEDPVAAVWQLAAIAPVSSLDQVSLLRSASVTELLTRVAELTTDAGLAYESPWPDADS